MTTVLKQIMTGIISIVVLFAFTWHCKAQEEKQYQLACIGFYNLENLFDTVADPDTNKILQDEYTPKGKKAWTADRYNKKLENMADVISQVGVESNPDGLAILGVSEIENRGVLEDLVKQEKIKDRNYNIVHYDSPDRRGVDVGLIYQPKYFKVKNSASYCLTIPRPEGEREYRSRDQLLVSGELNGDLIHIIVNHWPSRRGGPELRIAAADLTRHITDSLLNLDANSKIIIMGDLNDDPQDPSVRDHLKTVAIKEKAKDGVLFNTLEKLHKKGIGSLAYEDSWNLFDQIIISQGLIGEDTRTYKFFKAKIFKKSFMIQDSGRYKGYPMRTSSSGTTKMGYSDHLPTYIFVIKEV